jgi:hypothetical protein
VDELTELPVPPASVVARLIGAGAIGALSTQPPALRLPAPVEQPVAQRVRWERDEPGQPVVQRADPQPPAGINPSGANPYVANADGAGATVGGADLPPAYPTVSRAREIVEIPVQTPVPVGTPQVQVSYVVQRMERAGVPVTVQTASEPLAQSPPSDSPSMESPPAASDPAVRAAPAAAQLGEPAGAATAVTAAVTAAVEPEELLKKLFDPLLRRLKTELRLDRERYGALIDRL